MQYYKQYIIWLLNLYDYKNGITRQNTLFGLSITSAMLFLLIPGFHNEFLFFAALFNYLWATVATMCFVFMLNHIKEKNMSVYMLGLSMSSFFFGWLHEGITFPITLTLIIYCILNYHKHKIFKSPIFFCTVFYALGTFVCLSSPGTIQRIGQQDSLWQLMIQKSYLVELIYFIYVYHILCWLFLSFYSIRRELFGKSTSTVISIFT